MLVMQGLLPASNSISPIRVVIVDDSELVRDQVKAVLGELPNASVVGEAKSPHEAVEIVKEHQPEMVILNLFMRGWLGVDILSHIKGLGLPNHVYVLANYSSASHRGACLNAGLDLFFDRALECGKLKEIMKILNQPRHSLH